MKSAIIIIIVAVCCITLLGVLCCYRNRQDAQNINDPWISHGSHGNQVDTKIVILEGHKYIILDTDYGADIIHAESCNCKSKGITK
jgi:hypothetical protein